MTGLLGSIAGVLGGLIGTYFSIGNTTNPKERAFVVHCAIGVWLFVAAFLAGMFLLPAPYNFLLWIPFPILLIVGIRWMNARQARLRT
jgi:hypothetical protein